MFRKGEKVRHTLTNEIVWISEKGGTSFYWVRPKKGKIFRAAEFELMKIERKKEK